MIKLISWNVNGLRACVKKGFLDFLAQESPDALCLQETKMQPEQLEFSLGEQHPHVYWNSAVKKGYSGTAILAKEEPLSVHYDIDDPAHVGEGRCITAEYQDFYLVTVYTPNSQDELKRLGYRMEWDEAFRRYVMELDKKKPVVICGDMNVAHEEIDLKNPKTNHHSAGFSDEERANMTALLQSGFTDSFRYLNPELTGAYSWWSYRGRARENNAGWRIDYFLVSDRIRDKIIDARILKDVTGSDHCPVVLELKF